MKNTKKIEYRMLIKGLLARWQSIAERGGRSKDKAQPRLWRQSLPAGIGKFGLALRNWRKLPFTMF
jgi:hypothetical protein